MVKAHTRYSKLQSSDLVTPPLLFFLPLHFVKQLIHKCPKWEAEATAFSGSNSSQEALTLLYCLPNMGLDKITSHKTYVSSPSRPCRFSSPGTKDSIKPSVRMSVRLLSVSCPVSASSTASVMSKIHLSAPFSERNTCKSITIRIGGDLKARQYRRERTLPNMECLL